MPDATAWTLWASPWVSGALWDEGRADGTLLDTITDVPAQGPAPVAMEWKCGYEAMKWNGRLPFETGWIENMARDWEGVQLRGEVQCEASGCKVALRTREAKKSRKAGFAVYCVQFMHMMQRNLECEAQDMLGGACKTWPTVFNDWCNTCEEA